MKANTKMLETWRRYEAMLREYILSLKDVRNVGSLVFLVLVLLISWSGVKAIQTNYQLEKEVQKLNQQNALQVLHNSNQKLQNDYYTTPQYLEVTARENFGLASPGETELLVPKDVALAHSLPLPETIAHAAIKQKSFWQQNFESWIDFFFHRTQSQV